MPSEIPIPKIEYYVASPGLVDFIPTYPPVNKEPFGEFSAVRHDSTASIGFQQIVTERIDTFLNLEFNLVPLSDLASWAQFLTFALAGGVFSYYLDSTVDFCTQYTLESTDWKTKFLAAGFYSLTLKFRQLYPLSNSPA